ncbi:vacuolar protein sorting-associated protein 13 family protein [Cavenderia fasciculata]|uniref:RNA helicase n=1 Tax=Cavenderia fasciculata TaxID=261658 RepID=F4PTV7_CACFS|nr:vacuolar protein sorting-associated protein 13 family protein [Cavenderia fasciculata]EGG20936.1 vacuolar protein sorting-associated protein 13 family protein [Cavenderia fasciculata]|eukprot:XP_004358786.1 vacuolar protein sorting-associated protein 13 family protein [Cavenderia fasciculata]
MAPPNKKPSPTPTTSNTPQQQQNGKKKFTPNLIVKKQAQQQQPKINNNKDAASTTSTTSTTTKYKPVSQEILEQKIHLPVYSAREALIENIKNHPSVIIISETGTGKTTQIPQYLRESGFTKDGIVAITQPRRVAAISIAKRVSEEIGCELGTEVGYCVRFDDKTSPETRLKYMTDGMLVREAMIDPKLSKYSAIILDEAHERTLNTDILFALLKSIQSQRSSLKIIVMSATLDAELFSNYFNKAPILYIEGRQFPVRVYYTEETQKDYVDAALVTVLQIHVNEKNDDQDGNGGDILVFLTGREEIEALERLMVERIPRLPPDSRQLIVCPIYSALPQEQQMKVFERTPAGSRKVVIATNIAETSLTINGIRYVVDTGVAKTRIYNSKIGLDTLTVRPISQASAKQRSGRAGREFAGKCYRLYTEDLYEQLDMSSIAEIRRSSIAMLILQLKTIGIDDVLSFDFLERPPLETVQQSLELLYCLDALDSDGNLSPLGKKMSSFPLEPMYSKTLIMSEKFECMEEVLIIISMLSVESIFFSPKEKQKELEIVKRLFFSPEGDHLTLLNVFREYQKVNGNQQWCYDHFINAKSMVKVVSVFEQLLEYCTNSRMKISSCGEETERIRRCFITGFFLNIASLQPDGKYKTMADHREIFVHPTSFMFGMTPSHILYNELSITSKPFIRNITVIEPTWLPELVPKYYANKENQEENEVVKEEINNNNTNNDDIKLTVNKNKKSQLLQQPNNINNRNTNTTAPTPNNNNNNNKKNIRRIVVAIIMVFEGVIAEVIDRFLGSFLQEVTKKQLKIGLFGGNVVLKNIEVKPEAFRAFDLPIQVNRGVVGRLIVKVPWTSLKSESVVIQLEDIYIFASAAQQSSAFSSSSSSSFSTTSNISKIGQKEKEKEKEKDSSIDSSASSIDDAQLQDGTNGIVDPNAPPTKKKKDSFKEKLISKIINNLQIVVEKLHIRYEHPISDNQLVAVGVCLDKIFVQSADDKWVPTFIADGSNDQSSATANAAAAAAAAAQSTPSTSTSMNKLAEVSNISIYVDHLQPLQSLSKLATKELSSHLRESIPSAKDNKGHHMLLDPLCASLKLQLHQSSNASILQNNITKIDIVTVIEEIGLSLEPKQYSSLLSLLESLSEFVNEFKEEQNQSSKSAFETLIKKTVALKDLKKKKMMDPESEKKKEDLKKKKQEKRDKKEKEKKEKEEAKKKKKKELKDKKSTSKSSSLVVSPVLSAGGGDSPSISRSNSNNNLTNLTNMSDTSETDDDEDETIMDSLEDDDHHTSIKPGLVFDVETSTMTSLSSPSDITSPIFEKPSSEILKQQLYDTIGYTSPPPPSTTLSPLTTSDQPSNTLPKQGKEICLDVIINTIHIQLKSDNGNEGPLIYGDISGIKVKLIKRQDIMQLKADLGSIRLSGLWIQNEHFPDMISSGMSKNFLSFQMQMMNLVQSPTVISTTATPPKRKITIGIQVEPMYFVLNTMAILRYMQLLAPSHQIDLSGFSHGGSSKKKSKSKGDKIVELDISAASPTLIIPIQHDDIQTESSIFIIDLGKVTMNSRDSDSYQFQLDNMTSILTKSPMQSNNKGNNKEQVIPFNLEPELDKEDESEEEKKMINKTQLWCLKQQEIGLPVFNTCIDVVLHKRNADQDPMKVPRIHMTALIQDMTVYFSPFTFYQIRMFSHLLTIEIERVEQAVQHSFQFKLQQSINNNSNNNNNSNVKSQSTTPISSPNLIINNNNGSPDNQTRPPVDFKFSATVNNAKVIITNLINQQNNNDKPQDVILQGHFRDLWVTIEKSKSRLDGDFGAGSLQVYQEEYYDQDPYLVLTSITGGPNNNQSFVHGILLAKISEPKQDEILGPKLTELTLDTSAIYGNVHPQVLGNLIELIQMIVLVNKKVINTVIDKVPKSKKSGRLNQLNLQIPCKGVTVDIRPTESDRRLLASFSVTDPIVNLVKKNVNSFMELWFTVNSFSMQDMSLTDPIRYKEEYKRVISTVRDNQPNEPWVKFKYSVNKVERAIEAHMQKITIIALPCFMTMAKDYLLDLFQYLPMLFSKGAGKIERVKSGKPRKFLKLTINVQVPTILLPKDESSNHQLCIQLGTLEMSNQSIKKKVSKSKQEVKELQMEKLTIQMRGFNISQKYFDSSSVIDIMEPFSVNLSLANIVDPAFHTSTNIDCSKLDINIGLSPIVFNLNGQQDIIDQMTTVFCLLPLIKDFKTEMKCLRNSFKPAAIVSSTSPVLLKQQLNQSIKMIASTSSPLRFSASSPLRFLPSLANQSNSLQKLSLNQQLSNNNNNISPTLSSVYTKLSLSIHIGAFRIDMPSISMSFTISDTNLNLSVQSNQQLSSNLGIGKLHMDYYHQDQQAPRQIISMKDSSVLNTLEMTFNNNTQQINSQLNNSGGGGKNNIPFDSELCLKLQQIQIILDYDFLNILFGFITPILDLVFQNSNQQQQQKLLLQQQQQQNSSSSLQSSNSFLLNSSMNGIFKSSTELLNSSLSSSSSSVGGRNRTLKRDKSMVMQFIDTNSPTMKRKMSLKQPNTKSSSSSSSTRIKLSIQLQSPKVIITLNQMDILMIDFGKINLDNLYYSKYYSQLSSSNEVMLNYESMEIELSQLNIQSVHLASHTNNQILSDVNVVLSIDLLVESPPEGSNLPLQHLNLLCKSIQIMVTHQDYQFLLETSMKYLLLYKSILDPVLVKQKEMKKLLKQQKSQQKVQSMTRRTEVSIFLNELRFSLNQTETSPLLSLIINDVKGNVLVDGQDVTLDTLIRSLRIMDTATDTSKTQFADLVCSKNITTFGGSLKESLHLSTNQFKPPQHQQQMLDLPVISLHMTIDKQNNSLDIQSTLDRLRIYIAPVIVFQMMDFIMQPQQTILAPYKKQLTDLKNQHKKTTIKSSSSSSKRSINVDANISKLKILLVENPQSIDSNLVIAKLSATMTFSDKLGCNRSISSQLSQFQAFSFRHSIAGVSSSRVASLIDPVNIQANINMLTAKSQDPSQKSSQVIEIKLILDPLNFFISYHDIILLTSIAGQLVTSINLNDHLIKKKKKNNNNNNNNDPTPSSSSSTTSSSKIIYLMIQSPQLGITLINDYMDQNIPLLDLSLYHLHVEMQEIQKVMTISIRSNILADYFNNNRMAFEPLIESWNFSCAITKAKNPKLSLIFKSTQTLNLNLGYGFAHSFLTNFNSIQSDLLNTIPFIKSLFKKKKKKEEKENEDLSISSSLVSMDDLPKINISSSSPTLGETANNIIRTNSSSNLKKTTFLEPETSTSSTSKKASPLLQTISIRKLTSSFHPYWIVNKTGIDIEYQVVEKVPSTPPTSPVLLNQSRLFDELGSSTTSSSFQHDHLNRSTSIPILLENESKQPVQLDPRLLLAVKSSRDFRGFKQEASGSLDNGPFIAIKLSHRSPFSIPIPVGKVGITTIQINNRKILFEVGWNEDGSKLVTIRSNIIIKNSTTLNLELKFINNIKSQNGSSQQSNGGSLLPKIIFPNEEYIVPLQYINSNKKLSILPNMDQGVEYRHKENLSNLYKISTCHLINQRNNNSNNNSSSSSSSFNIYPSITLVMTTNLNSKPIEVKEEIVNEQIDEMIQDHVFKNINNIKNNIQNINQNIRGKKSTTKSPTTNQDDEVQIEESSSPLSQSLEYILDEESNIVVNILPPIQFENLLPCPLGLIFPTSIPKRNMVFKVESQKSLSVYCQDPRNSVQLMMTDVPGFNAQYFLLVDCSKNSEPVVRSSIRFQDEQEQMKPLNIMIGNKEMIENAKIPQVLTNVVEEHLPAAANLKSKHQPKLDKKKNCHIDAAMVLYHSSKLMLKLPNHKWSNSISLERGGTGGNVTTLYCEDELSTGELNFRANITLGKGNLQRTKMVTIDYQYIFVNCTPFPILIRQIDNNQNNQNNQNQNNNNLNSSYRIESGSKVPFNWSNKYETRYVQIKFDDDQYSWSGSFSIDEVVTMTIKIRNWTNSMAPYLARVDINVGTGLVMIGEENTSHPPFRIENNTPRTIKYYQSGYSIQDVLGPYQSTAYSWDETMSTRILVVDLGEQQQQQVVKFNIMKIKSFKPIKIGSNTIYSHVNVDGPTRVLYLTYEDPNSNNNSNEQSGDLEIGQLDLSLELAGIGISVIDHHPKELLYISLKNGISMEFSQSNFYSKLELIVSHFQIDNQLINADQPVLFYATPNVFNNSLNNQISKPFLHFSFVKNQQNKGLIFKKKLFKKDKDQNEMDDNNQNQNYDNNFIHLKEIKRFKTSLKSSKMIYTKLLLLHPIKVLLSFSFVRDGFIGQSQSEVVGILLEVLGISFSLERTAICLNSLMLEHPFLSKKSLISRIKKHYTMQSLNQLYKVIGSSDTLGNPVGLFNHLSTGVKDFFYEPAMGLVTSPKDFGKGLAKGSISLVKNSVYGLFNTLTKVSGAVGKGVSLLSFDEQYLRNRQRLSQKKARHALEGMAYGFKGLGKGVLDGVTGLVIKPVEGAQQQGVEGFAKGMVKGIVGLPIKPVVGAFDLATRTTEGIRNTTNLFQEAYRVRPPRFFGKEHILVEYNFDQSEGGFILLSTYKGTYKSDRYIAHFRLSKFIAVVTNQRLLCVRPTRSRYSFRWQVPLENIKSVSSVIDQGLLLTFDHLQKISMVVDYRSQFLVPIANDNDQLVQLELLLKDTIKNFK